MKKVRMAVGAVLTSMIGGLLMNSSCSQLAPLYGPAPFERDSVGEMICLYGVPPMYVTSEPEESESPEK